MYNYNYNCCGDNWQDIWLYKSWVQADIICEAKQDLILKWHTHYWHYDTANSNAFCLWILFSCVCAPKCLLTLIYKIICCYVLILFHIFHKIGLEVLTAWQKVYNVIVQGNVNNFSISHIHWLVEFCQTIVVLALLISNFLKICFQLNGRINNFLIDLHWWTQ